MGAPEQLPERIPRLERNRAGQVRKGNLRHTKSFRRILDGLKNLRMMILRLSLKVGFSFRSTKRLQTEKTMMMTMKNDDFKITSLKVF